MWELGYSYLPLRTCENDLGRNSTKVIPYFYPKIGDQREVENGRLLEKNFMQGIF